METVPITAVGFNQMPEGVAKIQGCSQTCFCFILLHNPSLDSAGAENRFFQKIQIQRFQLVLIQEIKQITVMNQPMLRQFEEACLELTRWQSFQQFEVHADMIRLFEGTNGIFPKRMIDSSFSTNAAVHLSQQGCRHLDHPDSPHESRRRKTGHISYHPATECHHDGTPVGLFFHQKIINGLERFQVFE